MAKIGYMRVPKAEQNAVRHLALLKGRRIKPDEVYEEKSVAKILKYVLN